MTVRRSRNPALAAMGDFLTKYPWAHFLTLTFRPPQQRGGSVTSSQGKPWGRFSPRIQPDAPVSLGYAQRHWQAFYNRVHRAAAVPLFFFYGVEYGERLGRLHLHALTGNTERLPVAFVRDQWRAGFSRVLLYDPNRGAGHYVAKYVTKEGLAEWDISDGAEECWQMARYRSPGKSDVQRLTSAAMARLRAKQLAETHRFPKQSAQLTFNN